MEQNIWVSSEGEDVGTIQSEVIFTAEDRRNTRRNWKSLSISYSAPGIFTANVWLIDKRYCNYFYQVLSEAEHHMLFYCGEF